MLFRTLHGKLSLILLALLCLFGGLSVLLTLFTVQRYQQEADQHLNRNLAASLAAHLTSENLISSDPVALGQARAEIKYLMAVNPHVDVYLLNAQGSVLTYSGAPADVRRGRVSLEPLRQFLQNTAPLPILGDDPRTLASQKAFSVAAVSAGGPRLPGQHESQVPRYVYVILGVDRYSSVAELLGRSYILRSSAGVLAATFALVTVTGMFLFRLLTRRLRQLTVAMEAFQDQDARGPEAALSLPSFLPWPGITSPRDEIDRLGVVYIQMADRIQGQLQKLAQADILRREMVSNVSHDLRTPLAALQGYLETLLIKEGSITAQAQREYLHVAIRHSERLSTLVGELFELAQLDARAASLRFEPFSLNELVQDIVQQHQLAAQQSQLRLQAMLPKSLPFVYADIAMIEKVLVNLLENALRYTPAGGLITLSLAPQDGKVAVRITDTGVGIGPADLPHIFERFYQVSRQPQLLGGTGLGLAIAKRILELHGSEIVVESTLGQGTSFTFLLPSYAPPTA